ncbi:MAG: hypothetical protein K2O18_19420 [Oscillospiraceae bacterium]|nr:hypothetical protein [Oscillospiraceae bacterium]
MENIYEQLYSFLAEPQMHSLSLEQSELIKELAAVLSVPPENWLQLEDIISYMRSQWGVDAFSIGLRTGLELLTPYESPSYYRVLRELLAKLNHPVA